MQQIESCFGLLVKFRPGSIFTIHSAYVYILVWAYLVAKKSGLSFIAMLLWTKMVGALHSAL
jgi:hypothetical protein